MYETLPGWMLILFWLFFLLTLGGAIVSVFRRKLLNLSILSIVLSMLIPITFVILSIRRNDGLDELQYLIIQLQRGSIGAIFVVEGTIFLFFWWSLFFLKNKPINKSKIIE
ncbi:hypothetical protein J2T19_002961 [Paenibacillus tundrae]|uniref:Uncharacterized protein n=1 Tax=Paenibacillus tundrae TaxID=528187 RepID=A0ABT9WEN4_9BACL|nr:hypothetical protein [Paenibacillus tundrae]